MILYNLRSTPDPNTFAITKFDNDFEIESTYEVSLSTCSCPAGHRPSCRHRNMLPRMLKAVNSDDFYCYETQQWLKPLHPQAVDLPVIADDPLVPVESPTPAQQAPPEPSPQPLAPATLKRRV